MIDANHILTGVKEMASDLNAFRARVRQLELDKSTLLESVRILKADLVHADARVAELEEALKDCANDHRGAE